ncbi:hypothetical protein K08M4_17410 [Vibrio syngnathi]|uniref:Uncharacterized protein n=1 Tax=Vibrio syngnathi TaxID=3034029 RepID=A0AA34TP45_9VIBR|nr:hypothetical protein K08M4_17410 [Vibrio syngnathi]
MKAFGFEGFFVSTINLKKYRDLRQKKAQTNAVWADTSIGVNKENAVIKKTVRNKFDGLLNI